MASFNSLEYAQKLQKGGLSKDLAETQAQAQFELFNALTAEQTSIKKDVAKIRQDISSLRQDMTILRYDMDREIKGLRSDFDKEIKLVSKQITIRVGYMMSGAVFVLVAMMKFLH